jgi:transcriptional regulator with XRE-family HTH domain
MTDKVREKQVQDTLRLLRDIRGMTNQELADELNVNHRIVTRLLAKSSLGKSFPLISDKQLKAIAGMLHHELVIRAFDLESTHFKSVSRKNPSFTIKD